MIQHYHSSNKMTKEKIFFLRSDDSVFTWLCNCRDLPWIHSESHCDPGGLELLLVTVQYGHTISLSNIAPVTDAAYSQGFLDSFATPFSASSGAEIAAGMGSLSWAEEAFYSHRPWMQLPSFSLGDDLGMEYLEHWKISFIISDNR